MTLQASEVFFEQFMQCRPRHLPLYLEKVVPLPALLAGIRRRQPGIVFLQGAERRHFSGGSMAF